MESKKATFLSNLSFFSLLFTFAVSAFFFVPYVPVSLDEGKGFLLSVGITLSLFFWLMARLSDGKFTIPKDRLLFFGFLIPIVFFVSSFFSFSKYLSFFGQGFEVGTFGSMFILFLVMFLSATYFQTEKRLWYFYRTLFIGAAVLAVFELLNIFIGFDRIAPGMVQGAYSGNLFGSWNNFALFFGMVIILCLFTIEFLRLKKIYKLMLYLLTIVSLFFLAVINISLVWLFVGIFSLLVFVYSVSFQQANIEARGEEGVLGKKIPVTALVVALLCLFFLINSNLVGGLIFKYFNLSNIEVRPSADSTFSIVKQALKHNPLLGTGPNTFDLAWAKWRPEGLSQTIFWNADFKSGVGLFPTFMATTGIAGLLAWLLFLVIFCLRGIQSLKIALKNAVSNYLILASFSIALYGWIVFIVYSPNLIMLMITFATSGVFIGSLVYKNVLPVHRFSFLNDPRASFFSILALVLLMIVSISTTYIYAEKFASTIYFAHSQSIKDTTPASLNYAESSLLRAIALDPNDQYYVALSQVYLADLSVAAQDKTLSEEASKKKIQDLITATENAGVQATVSNPNQYNNWVNLGNIYNAFTSLGIAKSYDVASAVYKRAEVLSPNNPFILLLEAQLEVNNKNVSGAVDLLDKALLIKPDYTDAITFKKNLQGGGSSSN